MKSSTTHLPLSAGLDHKTRYKKAPLPAAEVVFWKIQFFPWGVGSIDPLFGAPDRIRRVLLAVRRHVRSMSIYQSAPWSCAGRPLESRKLR